MAAATLTVGAAEAGDRRRQVRQCRSDGAFVSVGDNPGAFDRPGGGEAVDVPVRLFLGAGVAEEPSAKASGTAGGAGVEEVTGLEGHLGTVRAVEQVAQGP